MIEKNNLHGKRILYICTPFHEYPNKIKLALESLKAEVNLFFIYKKSFLSTFLLNISQYLYHRYRNYQNNRILQKNLSKHYDYILIQNPYFLGHFFLNTLKNNFPQAVFINYNWDSIEDMNYLDFVKYFNKVYSFDKKDCEQNKNIIYLPLFFDDVFLNKDSTTTKWDVSFVGGIGDSQNRYEFVLDFEKQCTLLGINFNKYLFIPPNYFIKGLVKGKYYKKVKFKKLNLREIAKIYSFSNCVLDYHNPKQSGLTMRTFEVLGSGCKLITTNQSIIHEPFYDDQIIQVIDKDNININYNFVKSNRKRINCIEEYSINKWILKIFQYEE